MLRHARSGSRFYLIAKAMLALMAFCAHVGGQGQADRAKLNVPAKSAFTMPRFSRMDSLFIIAATGEPRFKKTHDSCEKILVGLDTATLDYLLSQRLTGQTPRQRHYVEHLFALVSDSGKNIRPALKLKEALPGRVDSVRAQLLHIGSELGDTGFLSVARLYLTADSVEVRKAAIRSLGNYPNPEAARFLLAGLEKTTGLERQERLWALSKQKTNSDWPKLLSLLDDPDLCNRELIRQIAVKAVAADWNTMVHRLPAVLEPAARLEWMLMALECGTSEGRAFVKSNLPALDTRSRRFLSAMLF